MAAAPELLAVCQTIARWPHPPGDCAIVDQARAAVQKVLGGPAEPVLTLDLDPPAPLVPTPEESHAVETVLQRLERLAVEAGEAFDKAAAQAACAACHVPSDAPADAWRTVLSRVSLRPGGRA